ncbi:hypothetical protein BJ165DRAFT_1351094 [Panaeolus papilionaceus]|nr:hypothetical protein BJ165DRAFT_1351094 [Panaeolus papilionaceus]
MDVNAIAVPNPLTPMAFLPEGVAYQASISHYIAVGTCAVLIWEMLHNLRDDYKLLTKFNVRLPTNAYFFSRLACLQYVLATAIFDTASITLNCGRFQKILSITFAMALPSTSFLFFLRPVDHCIYDRNPIIVGFFTSIWTIVLAASLTPLIGMAGLNIGPTRYCIVSKIDNYVASAALAPLVFDTLVFSAITRRLMGNTHIDYNLRTGLKALLFGDYLPAFSKALLQDGQVYYLTTTVFITLTSVITLYIPDVPPSYRAMFSPPNVAVMNIMACRVFRNTKFGIYRENQIATSRLIATQELGARAPIAFRNPTPAIAVNTFKNTDQDIPLSRSHNLRFQVPESPCDGDVEVV